MSTGSTKGIKKPDADSVRFSHWRLLAAGVLFLLIVPPEAMLQTCPSLPVHFTFATNTGDDFSIVVSQGDSTCAMQPCDEVGVFDGELCVGATVFDSTWPIAIVAWKDDSQTEHKDGYTQGNQISFRIWHNGSNVEEPSEPHFTVGNGTFGAGAYALVWQECPNSCCEGMTGNVDNDPADIVDIGDLSDLIWYLYLDGPIPQCPAEANIDGDPAGVVDLGDLTALIDYLFISFTPPAECL